MLWLSDRFGWDAAHKAPRRELRCMIAAENVYNAVIQRKAAAGQEGGWAKWALDNPRLNAAYEQALLAAQAEDSE